MKVNAGEIVELAVRRKNINISELSRRMQVNRRTLYNWFQQKQLPIDVIREIGKAIDYDFYSEFKDEFHKYGWSDIQDGALNPERTEQNSNQDILTHWMQKYITLLEEYNFLISANHLNKNACNNGRNEIEPMKLTSD
nr:hypothetical protein [uncultured Pedobacter sp.]